MVASVVIDDFAFVSVTSGDADGRFVGFAAPA